MRSTGRFFIPGLAWVFADVFSPARHDAVMIRLLDRRNMTGDLSDKEDSTLKELIKKKIMNLKILEWLRDSLNQEYQNESRRVRDFESRYAKGKVEIRKKTAAEKNFDEFSAKIEKEIKIERSIEIQFDKDLEDINEM